MESSYGLTRVLVLVEREELRDELLACLPPGVEAIVLAPADELPAERFDLAVVEGDHMQKLRAGAAQLAEADRAREESEQRLELVSRATQEALWDWMIPENRAWWNDANYDVFGYDRGTTPSLAGWLERVHPDDRELVRDHFVAAVERGESVWNDEYRLRLADGSWGVVLDRGYVQLGPGGKPVRMIGAMMDITERKRAELAMTLLGRASGELFSSLDFDLTLEASARLPVPALADRCVVHLCESSGEVRRIASSSLGPGGQPDVVHADFTAALPLELLAEVMREGRPRVLTDPIAEAAPETHTLLAPIVVGRDSLGVMALTARKDDQRYDKNDLQLALELAHRAGVALEQARLYRDARAAISARDEFISIAAHEMKTPLATLSGYAQLLGKEAVAGERSGSMLRAIRRQCARLDRMIQRMLELSRLGVGQFVLYRQPVDLGALVRACVNRLSLVATARHTITVSVNGPVWADADADRIDEVVSNLVENAIRFSPGGGEITVSVTRSDNQGLVSVRDRGIGIPPEDRARVFERFYRAHAASRQDYGGLGIGLWVCHEIVARHGGRIWAEPAPEQGTIFSFSLSLARDEPV